MNENYRHQQLLSLLAQKKRLSTQEIMDSLAISPATARRDISKLNEQGKLKKVRNGAEALDQTVFSLPKPINHSDEKQRIAMAATKLCQDVDSVILTCGTTMQMLGANLCGQRLQIITNFLPLANYLIEHDHHNVVIMGGQYNKNQAITLSLHHNESMYAANILFTSGRGITTEGLYKTDMLIANSEQKMLKNIGKLVVLMDSSKLGKQAGMLFCDLAEIDLLITGREADPQIIQRLREKGLEIILA